MAPKLIDAYEHCHSSCQPAVLAAVPGGADHDVGHGVAPAPPVAQAQAVELEGPEIINVNTVIIRLFYGNIRYLI